MKGKTRDGREYEILRADLKSSDPIVAIISCPDGREMASTFGADGKLYGHKNSEIDLMLTKRKFHYERWANVHKDDAYVFFNRATADFHAGPDRIACVPITIEGEEGDGL